MPETSTPGVLPAEPRAPAAVPARPVSGASESSGRFANQRFDFLFHQTQDLVLILGPEGLVTEASPSCERVLGREQAAFRGVPFAELASPEGRAQAEQWLREARQQAQPCHNQVTLLDRAGKPVRLEGCAVWLREPQGTPAQALVVLRDTTAQRQAEEEIQRLAAFPQSNPNPIFSFAADGSLTYFNAAAQAMAQRLNKAHPQELLPLNAPVVVGMCLAANDPELQLENTVAGRTLRWSFYPLVDRQIVHCYAEDITERIELENRARQSQKMESVGLLAAGVAHDFNNVLTVIHGHADLLLATYDLGPAFVEAVQQISQAAERGANLTRQLLMFSRKQPAQKQLLNLNEVLQESGKMLRVLAGESVTVEMELGALPPIYADAGMLQQILLNLVANARDAMPKGGQLRLASRCVEVTSWECAHNPEARPGRFVVLSVADTGCGMDAATLERIFDPFFTTKPTGEGTGLGLATVYGIVKQHQGWVEVTSAVGQGSTFRVYFPAASKARESDEASAKPEVRGGHETILVVEDEEPLRELVVEILRQYGYQTIEARHGAEALEIWAARQGEIDLVLTDVMMPGGVSGRDLAEKVLNDNPAMKVIYSSGYPMDVLGQDFFQNAANFFLPKPYHPHTLAKMVRDCLDGKTPG